jgi:murein DD-endopeptidase MepM/ murein hydrolase activator NlpD
MRKRIAVLSFAAILIFFAHLTSTRTCADTVTLYWPVSGTITGTFTANHPALDISANTGTPVRAASAGRVTYAGWSNNGGGNVVTIDHGAGVLTSYNHLSAVSVAVGQSVTAYTLVGRVGATGTVTGPHLHFWVMIGNRFVDPMLYLQVRPALPDTAVPACGS